MLFYVKIHSLQKIDIDYVILCSFEKPAGCLLFTIYLLGGNGNLICQIKLLCKVVVKSSKKVAYIMSCSLINNNFIMLIK